MATSVKRIHQIFAGHGSPVAANAAAFVRYGKLYGVNPALIAAIVMKETEGGKTGTGRPGQYNLTGVGGVGNMRSYPNYVASIRDTARNLGSSRYKGKSFAQQTAMWVSGGPPSASNVGYTADVLTLFHKFGGAGVVGPVSTGKQRGKQRGARGGGGGGAVPPVVSAPLPRLIPNVTSQPKYAHMAMPTQGVPPGQLMGAPGQAGAVRRYKGYKAAQPKLDRQIAQVAKVLTPPAVAAAGPAPAGKPKGGKPAVGAGGAGGKMAARWPTAKKGSIIGTPYSGTHTLGNWQSDRAVDIGVPIGTPIVAVRDGKIGRVDTSHHGDTGRFGGDAIYLDFPGDEVWYKHLSRVVVKSGQRVRKGQVIGYSGIANGTAHLHFASKNKLPYAYIG